MKHSIYISFILLFFTSGTTEGWSIGEAVFASWFMAVLYFSYPKVFIVKSSYLNPMVKKHFVILLVATLILLYGTGLSILNSNFPYAWVKDLYKFAPLLLYFPFAYHMNKRSDWIKVFSALIVLGIVTSVRDILLRGSWNASHLTRLVSSEMRNLDYFVAIFFCIGFILFVENKRLYFLSVVALPILLFRMIVSGNKTMFGLLLIGVALLVAKRMKGLKLKPGVMTYWLPRMFTIGVFMICFGTLYFVSPSAQQLLTSTSSFVEERFKTIGLGLSTRSIEYKVVFDELVHHPFGEGFGSVANFGEIASYYKSAVPIRPYVHNMYLYILWKLGFLVGGLLIVLIVFKTFQVVRRAWRMEDPLGWVSVVILLQYLGYGMTETYYKRHDFNLLLALVLGFIVYVEQCGRSPHVTEGVDFTVSKNTGQPAMILTPGQKNYDG